MLNNVPNSVVLFAGFLQGSALSAVPQHIVAASRRAPLCIEYVSMFPNIELTLQPSMLCKAQQ